jgi:hypothetical protein
MDQDDVPPKQGSEPSDDETFAGALGRTFAGVAWVAVFAVIAGLMLWGVVHLLR